MERRYFVEADSEERVYELEQLEADTYRVDGPDGSFEAVARRLADGSIHLLVEGQSVDANATESDAGYAVWLDGNIYPVEVLSERQKRMRRAGVGPTEGNVPELKSPIAGRVVSVPVSEGDQVETDQVVVVVEAMKMENDLKAHRAGTISEVSVAVGDEIESGDTVVVID